MPNKSDIVTALKNSSVFLKVPELKDATVKLNSNGQPYFFTGGFTMVFQLTKNSKKWAFRVWHTGFNKQKDRFQKISKYLEKQKLPYFADFIYDEKGLLVNGEFVDTIRMEWLEGDLLKDYIEKNLNNKQKIQNLADSFMSMCEALYKHRISHGDLQHGNILIDSQDNIRLIDYDSVCVPDIEGAEELVTGLRGYQHLSRINSANKASLKADYFSELIIYLSLCALAENSLLWDKFKVKGTDVLLFSDEDFENLQQSEIYKYLLNINSGTINDLLQILVDYLSKSSYLDLEPFGSYLKPPEIIYFKADPEVSIHTIPATLQWKVENVKKIEINNGIGDVTGKQEINVLPDSNTIYTLTAYGKSTSTCFAEIGVRVFPTPIIKSLLVPMPDFESRINLNSIVINPPKIDVAINMPEFNLELPNFNLTTPKFIEPSDDFLKLLKAKSNSKVPIFNFSKIYKHIKSYVRKRNRV